MSEQPEDPIAMAERHIREGEARVARQLGVIEELDRDNHPEAAATAREMLAALQHTLDLMREHLSIKQDMARARMKLRGTAPEN